MSSVLHPVGPEDKGTYWRRRLVVVLALVVVIVLIAVGVRALTTPDDANAQGPTKLDPSTVATTDAQAPTGSPTGGSTGSSTGTAPASSGGGTETTTGTATTPATACSDQSLAVTLTTKATTYGPGQAPNLVLTVENTSQTACTVETSSAVRVLRVSDAAGAQVWSSADCQTKGESATDELAPGATRSKSITWSRQRSAAGCPTGQAAVEPGSYTVDGTWDGVAATPMTLALTG